VALATRAYTVPVPLTVADLSLDRNPLAAHYSRFRVAERLLLTGHSHQAWPDAGFAGQQQAWAAAAELVDDKWTDAARVAGVVASHWKELLTDRSGDIALGGNTHELVTRLLSALPLDKRARLVSTDAEFHTIRRQLARLAEAGLDVVRIVARPVDTLAERLATAVDDRTACLLVSSVLYETADVVPGLHLVAEACARHGVVLVVDAYHHINALPFDLDQLGLQEAFVTGGGYKYCQLGEGNAFLRVPPDCQLRPVLTGWYAEFTELEQSGTPDATAYGRGAARFAGATYDPTSHYRAAAVQAFHREHALTPELLRKVSLHQVGLLRRLVEALDIHHAVARVEEMPADRRGAFLAIRMPLAVEVSRGLRQRGVWTDARGPFLRLGPAPYLTDGQLRDAVQALGEVLRAASTQQMPARRAEM
jgi:kynureninase